MEKFLVPASGVFRAQGAQLRGLDRSNCQADHDQPLDELQRAFSNDTKAVPEPSAMPAGSFAPPVPPEFPEAIFSHFQLEPFERALA
jgi:hypothetical protein